MTDQERSMYRAKREASEEKNSQKAKDWHEEDPGKGKELVSIL